MHMLYKSNNLSKSPFRIWIYYITFHLFFFLGKHSSNHLDPDYVPSILVQTTPNQEIKIVEILKRDSQKLERHQRYKEQ